MCDNEDESWEGAVSISKSFVAEFADSVFRMEQLPRDGLAQVAVAGRSNVGKSSLLNKLWNRKGLAKVSATPGKTRSLNFFKIDDTFYFVDLPGYGYAKVAKSVKSTWGPLIEQYLTTGQELAGLLLLLDCRRDLTEEDRQLVSWLAKRDLPVLVVMTKADKIGRDQMNRKVKLIEAELGVDAIPFSSTSGVGKNELTGAVRELLAEHTKQKRVT